MCDKNAQNPEIPCGWDPRPASNMKRCLRLVDLVCIGVGATLGIGAYQLTGEVASAKAGPGVVLAYVCAAIGSVFSGICYAELGCRVPKAGSGYAFLYATIGELPAFCIGWLLLQSYIVGASAIAVTMTTYLNEISNGWVNKHFLTVPLQKCSTAGGCTIRENVDFMSCLLIFFLGGLLCSGVKEMASINKILLFVNMCTLLTIIGSSFSGIFNFSTSKINFSNWGFDVSEKSSEVKDFLNEYYNETNMVRGVVAVNSFEGMVDGVKLSLDYGSDGLVQNFENSLVYDYCKNNKYEFDQRSYSEVNNTVKMSCVLKDRYLGDVEDKSIQIERTSGTLNFGVENNNTLVIQDKFLGQGDFLPYGWHGLARGTTSCFFAYLGYESIASTGEEAIDPKTNIPNAILISLFFVCFVYMTLSSVITLNFPYFMMDPKTPFPSVLSWNGMGVINTWVRIGTLCAITNALLGVLFPSTRIVYNMADDGLVYRWMGRVNKKTQVPIAATMVCTVVGGLLCLFFNPSSLLDFSTMGTLAAFAMSANCVIILRYTPSKQQLCLGEMFREVNSEKVLKLSQQEGVIRKYAYTLSGVYLFGFLGIDKIPLIKESFLANENTVILSDCAQILLLLIILSSTVYVIMKINKLEVSKEDVYFKTPFMPYFPIMNLFINFYLMSVLEGVLWLYFAIWMSIGIFIYMSYGIWNSSERDSSYNTSLSGTSDGRGKVDKNSEIMESGLTLLNHQ